jgi:transposase-like protein
MTRFCPLCSHTLERTKKRHFKCTSCNMWFHRKVKDALPPFGHNPDRHSELVRLHVNL